VIATVSIVAIAALTVVASPSHLASHSTKDMPPKLKNWGKRQKEECVKQFNLFETTNGSDGWDPREVDDSYIKPHVKLNDVCRPYLSVALGGHSKNKDSSKAIRGYRRAASEYFVTLPRQRSEESVAVRALYTVVEYLVCPSFSHFYSTFLALQVTTLRTSLLVANGRWKQKH
jgi:hypothetical protein